MDTPIDGQARRFYDGGTDEAPPAPEMYTYYLQNPPTNRLDQQNHAVRHLRTWTVGSNGIARVEVQLEQLTLRRELTLAVMEPPFGNIQPDEVAHAILFLASENSRPINGQNIHAFSA